MLIILVTKCSFVAEYYRITKLRDQVDRASLYYRLDCSFVKWDATVKQVTCCVWMCTSVQGECVKI